MSGWSATVTGSTGDMIADRDTFRQGMALFVDPDLPVEIGTLVPQRFKVVDGKDLAKIEAEVGQLPIAKGAYFRVNPLLPGTGINATNADIAKRRWIYIDVDADKPADFTNDSATDREKNAAAEIFDTVFEYLATSGWPAPVITDSGNGYGLFYRCDLPNTDLVQAVYRRLLVTLSDRFAKTKRQIDLGVHNANRLVKIPGTWARKGRPGLVDRPYRPCLLLNVPTEMGLVTFEQMKAVAGEEPQATVPPPPPPSSNGKKASSTKAEEARRRAYVTAVAESEYARISSAVPGTRNTALYKGSVRLGRFLGTGLLFRDDVEVRLFDAACAAGLDRDPGCGVRGIRSTIKSGLDDGVELPRDVPPPPPEPPRPKDAEPVFGKKGDAGSTAGAGSATADPVIYWASSVTPKSVEWLWPKRIPLGKLTTFAGIGGLGKTFVLCDISARVTRGGTWPDGSGPQPPGKVLFISGEDDAEDTLVPRMIELGADLSRVAFLKTEIQDRFVLSDVATLEKALEQMGPEARFVAIDPPTAYLGDVNDHKNSELRRLLTPLKTLTAKHRVAMVFNTHFTKPSAGKIEAMMRVMGSVAWVNAVRAAHMFGRDPEDPERRLFIGMKNNLGPEVKGLAYQLEIRPNDQATIKWVGDVDMTADDALNRQTSKKRRVDPHDWLAAQFEGTTQLPSKVIFKNAKATTISDDALREAKDDMGIKARQDVGPDGVRAWFWIWSPDERRNWERKMGSDGNADG